MRWRAIEIFSAMVAVSPALAGTIRHDVDDSNYTSLAAEARYASVGAVLFTIATPEGPAGRIGSGTLVASDWVLTAGHIVGGNDFEGGGITNMRFVLGSTATGTPVFADDWIPLPGWNGSTFSGLDVGLVHLSSDIFSVTPAKRYIGTGEKTMTGTNVGYGRTGTGTSGDTVNPGVKRAGNNVLDLFGNEYDTNYSSNIVLSDFDRPSVPSESSMGSSTPLALEYQIAGGDSGGPVFVDVDTDTLIAAVHSFLRWDDNSGNADYGDKSGSTRLNGVWQTTKIINDWISSVITVPGDVDSDFDVDLSDLSALAGSYGMLTGGHWHLGDFDLDGDVDLNDLSSLASNYGSGEAQAFTDFASLASVPEPAGLAMVALTALCVRWRHRA